MKRTSREIRTANRYRVLRQAIADSPVSRPRLAAATGLSTATVATLVGELAGLGLLVDAGYEDSGGGRPRGLVAVNPRGGTLVGVDVAETYVHAELFDLSWRALASSRRTLRPADLAPRRVVRVIAAAVRAVAEHRSAAGRRPLGVGISMPGVVDRTAGVSVVAPNWGWQDVPLLRLLAEHLPHQLFLDNPLHACLAAELWSGAARGRDDAVVVNLGTGVGAGLALGGELHRGAFNSAGEWGHTTLVLDGRACHCGRRGCVETYVGAPGIVRNLREMSPDSPLLSPDDDQTATIAALSRGCREGDPVAVKAVGESGAYLGAAVADLVNLLDPEIVVLSGWVAGQLGEPLLREVRAAVARQALRRPAGGAEIVLSPVAGASPVSLGAASFALEGVLAAPDRP
ncbi:ROK family protein [Streptomyces sp. 4N509B]|uniref:ROK family protein n=1 Tax=Streptomyces sp. 4N509B TaxID=3457413 RepID=UPI003FD3D684